MQDITRVGDQVRTGGVIDSVTDRTTSVTANDSNAISFNARTGAIRTDFRPQFVGADGRVQTGAVRAVERSTGGTAVWFGGEFKKVDGTATKGLVRWDVATNKRYAASNARIGADNRNSRGYDVKYFCNRLWVAGDFTSAELPDRTRRGRDAVGGPPTPIRGWAGERAAEAEGNRTPLAC